MLFSEVWEIGFLCAAKSTQSSLNIISSLAKEYSLSNRDYLSSLSTYFVSSLFDFCGILSMESWFACIQYNAVSVVGQQKFPILEQVFSVHDARVTQFLAGSHCASFRISFHGYRLCSKHFYFSHMPRGISICTLFLLPYFLWFFLSSFHSIPNLVASAGASVPFALHRFWHMSEFSGFVFCIHSSLSYSFSCWVSDITKMSFDYLSGGHLHSQIFRNRLTAPLSYSIWGVQPITVIV